MCGFLYPLAKVSTLEEPKVFTRVRDSRVLETQECDMHSSFFADIRRVKRYSNLGGSEYSVRFKLHVDLTFLDTFFSYIKKSKR
jgi:hypothetical protein